MTDEQLIALIMLALMIIGLSTIAYWIYKIIKEIITTIFNTIKYGIWKVTKKTKRKRKRKKRGKEETYIDACWEELKKK